MLAEAKLSKRDVGEEKKTVRVDAPGTGDRIETKCAIAAWYEPQWASTGVGTPVTASA